MNAHCYRLVVCRRTGQLVPVPECASAGGGLGGRPARRARAAGEGRGVLPLLSAIAVCVALAWAPTTRANPVAPTVVSGKAAFATSGRQLTVTNTPGAIINWGAFSIGQGETTRFQQGSAGSVVLNRVTGSDPSSLLGTLSSNGKVFLINPNGVIFGQGSRVDTQGFLAATLDMTDADFRAGHLRFTGDAGRIDAAGHIDGGTGNVTLISPDLVQEGDIATRGGQVVLAAGRQVTLGSTGLDGIRFEVQAPTDRAVNLGRINAGAVGLFAGSLRQQGQIQALQISRAGGRIVLEASGEATLTDGSLTQASGTRGGQVSVKAGGDAVVQGTVSATGTAGVGGSVDVLGANVAIVGAAQVDASGDTGGGKLRIGGDLHGGNAAVPNAATTLLGADAVLRADATTSGNGGTAIIWSDRVTQAFGQVSVRGGAQGGDGGFAEVSGKQHLDFHASVDRSAPKGQAGTLLLDPSDILISDATDSPADLSPYEASIGSSTVVSGFATPSQVSWSTVDSLLAGGNLVITTSGSGGAGNITLAGSHSLSAPFSLSLLAHNDITQQLGSVLENTSSVGGITMVAGWDESTGIGIPLSVPGVGHLSVGRLSFADNVQLLAGSDIGIWNTVTSRNGDILADSFGGKLVLSDASINSSHTTFAATGATGTVTVSVPQGIEWHAGGDAGTPDIVANKFILDTGGPVAFDPIAGMPGSLYLQVNQLDVTLRDSVNYDGWDRGVAYLSTIAGASALDLTHASLGRNSALRVQATGDLNVTGPVTSADPYYQNTLELWSQDGSGSVNIGAGGSISQVYHTAITSDSMQIDGPIDTGTLVLQTINTTRGINIGTEDPTRMSLTAAEIGHITAGELQVFGGDAVISAPITTGSIGVWQTGWHVTVMPGSPLTLTQPGSYVDFNAATVDLFAPVTAGTQGIALGQNVITRLADGSVPDYIIGLPDGAPKPGLGGLELTQQELSLLHTTGPVFIGDIYNAGRPYPNPLRIVGPIDMTGITDRLYLSGSTITEENGATITVPQLAATAWKTVNLATANHVGIFAGAVTDVDTPDASSLDFRADASGFQVGALHSPWFNTVGVSGPWQVALVADGGSITQQAGAAITVNQLLVGAHQVTLNDAGNVAAILRLAIDTDAAAATLGAMTLDYTQNSLAAGSSALLIDNNAGVRTGALTLRGAIPVAFTANPYVFQGASADTPMVTKVLGSLSVPVGATLGGTGTVDVASADGMLAVAGTLQPGVHYPGADALGTLKVNGALALASTAAVDMRLQASDPGQFDQLAVSGQATLDGNLTVSSTGTPVLAADVPMLTFAGRSGAFASITAPTAIDHVYNVSDLTFYQGAGGGAAVSWDNDSGDGQWTTAINWSGNVLPVRADAVTINAGAGTTVTLASGDQSMATLTVTHKDLAVTGGSLTVANGFSMTDGLLSIGTGARVTADGSTSLDRLGVAGGTLAGHGAIHAGQLDWASGHIHGDPGSSDPAVIIDGAATIHNTLGQTMQLETRALDIGGALTIAGSNWLDLVDGASLTAHAPTLLDTSGGIGSTFFGINSLSGNPSSVNFLGGITKTGALPFDVAVQANTTGTVHAVQGELVFDAGFVAASTGGTHVGTLFVADAGASVEFARGTQTASGTVSFAGAGQIVFRGASQLAAAPTATVTNTGTLVVEQGAGVSAGLNNQGTLRGSDGVVLSGAIVNAPTGTIVLADANLGGGLANSGMLDVETGVSAVSTLTALTGGNSGTVHVGGGATLVVGSSPTNNPGGVIDGTGVFDTFGGALTNHGVVAPGGEGTVGTLTISGQYTQAADGALHIDLGGAGAGQSDLLAVSGNATLAGTLTAQAVSGYSPGEDVIPVLSFGSRSGAFDAFTLPTGFSHIFSANALSLGHSSFAGVSWDNDSGDGLWTTPINWSGNTLPLATDAVQIQAGAGNRVSLVDGNETVGSLNVVGKTLRLDGGSLTVNGTMRSDAAVIVDGGTLNLNGATALHDVTLTLGTIAGTGNIDIDHALQWTAGRFAGSGTTTLDYSATGLIGGPVTLDRLLVNQGSLKIAADSVVAGTQTLTNAGQLTIDSAAVSARMDYQNGSTLDIVGATSLVSGIATQLGNATIEPGATLIVASAGGPGNDGINAASVDVAGVLQARTPLSINHLKLEGTGVIGSADGHVQSWALISAADTMLAGGVIDGGAHVHTYQAVVDGGRVDHASFDADNTVDQSGDLAIVAGNVGTTGSWNLHSGALSLDAASTFAPVQFNVLGNGALTGSTSFAYASIFGGATLTLRPTAAGQTFGGSLSNVGTLRIDGSSGGVTTLAATVSSGALDVLPGATLQLASSNNHFAATTLGGTLTTTADSQNNDLGALAWTGAADLTLDNGGTRVSADSLVWTGSGRLNGTLVVAGPAMIATQGVISGSLQIAGDAQIAALGGSAGVSGQLTAANVSQTGYVKLADRGSITTGVYTLADNADLETSANASVRAADLVKNGSGSALVANDSNSSSLDVDRLDVHGGTLVMQRLGATVGSGQIDAGTTLNLVVSQLDGGALTSAGAITVQPLFAGSGNAPSRLGVSVSGGTLDVASLAKLELGGSHTHFDATSMEGDRLLVTAGSDVALGRLTWSGAGDLVLTQVPVLADSLTWNGNRVAGALTGTLSVSGDATILTGGWNDGRLSVGGTLTLGSMGSQFHPSHGSFSAGNLVQTGWLELAGSGAIDVAGAYTIGADLQTSGNNTRVHAGQLVKTGNGTVFISNDVGANVLTADSLTVDGTLNLERLGASVGGGQIDTGATLNLIASQLDGGALASAGAIAVQPLFAGSGNPSSRLGVSVSGGTLDVASLAKLELGGSHTHFDATSMEGDRLLVTAGSDVALGQLAWSGSGDLWLTQTPVLADSLNWNGNRVAGSLNGTLSVSGGATILAGGWNDGRLNVGGTLNLGSMGSQFHPSHGSFSARDLVQTGSLELAGSGSVDVAGTYTIGADLVASGNATRVHAGNLVKTGTGTVSISNDVGAHVVTADTLAVDGTLALDNVGVTATSGRVNAGAELQLWRSDLGGSFASAGTIAVVHGGAGSEPATRLDGSVTGGIVDVNSGASLVVNDGYVNATGTRLQGAGTVIVGAGTGTLINQGVIAPGTSTSFATLSISGNLQQALSGSIVVREDGTGNHSGLAVSGVATLGGSLSVAGPGIASANPALNFDALTFASHGGAFTAVSTPAGLRTSVAPADVAVLADAGMPPVVVIGLVGWNGFLSLMAEPVGWLRKPVPTWRPKAPPPMKFALRSSASAAP